jgi:hypothetical protein
MTTEIILTIIGTLGLGTVIGAYFQSNFQHSKELKMDNHELKTVGSKSRSNAYTQIDWKFNRKARTKITSGKTKNSSRNENVIFTKKNITTMDTTNETIRALLNKLMVRNADTAKIF